MKKQHIKLTEEDKKFIEDFLSKGTAKVISIKRATALQMLNEGATKKAVEKQLKVSYPTVCSWANKYKSEGLSFLHDKPRSGRPRDIDGITRAKITAVACTEPPQGYARWSLRLLADKVVELSICETISHTEIGNILKKTNCNLTENDNGASVE